MPPWGDVCLYHNACFTGNAWYFFEDSAPKTIREHRIWSGKDVRRGVIYPNEEAFGKTGMQPIDTEVLPFNGADPGAVFMHPDALLTVPNVTWVDNAPLWVTSHSNPLDNIYYFVSRVTPLFKARKLNATGGMPFQLPPLRESDVIYMPTYTRPHRTGGPWCDAMLQAVTGLDAPRVERPSTPWGQALNDKNVVCYREVVMVGTFGYVLPDVETAFDFRRAIYGVMKVPIPKTPAKKVLVVLRGDPPARRAIVNAKEMLAVMDNYGIEYTVIKGIPGASFKDQFDLYSTHGVMITPHGAALLNMMLMPPMSAVIELFPYHLHHTLYATMATHLGIVNYPVHAVHGRPTWEGEPDYWKFECLGMTGMQVNLNDSCRGPTVNMPFEVDIPAFEVAIVNAMDHIGQRMYYKGIKPVRSETARTKWTAPEDAVARNIAPKEDFREK